MVDKTTRDWKDVETLVELLKGGNKLKDLAIDAACLSHVKYPINGRTSTMHNKRKKYRTWLMNTAIREYKKQNKRVN